MLVTHPQTLQKRPNLNKLFLTIGILVIFNIIAFVMFMPTGGYDGDGVFHENPSSNLKTSLNAFLVGFPILAFLLGLVVAIFPYKQLPYGKKYLRASLLTLIVINSIVALFLLFKFVMTVLKGSSAV